MGKAIIELKNNFERVGLWFDDRYWYLMATTTLNPKGHPKGLKRLVRIKRNVIRELKAFDKELKRHPTPDDIEGAGK